MGRAKVEDQAFESSLTNISGPHLVVIAGVNRGPRGASGLRARINQPPVGYKKYVAVQAATHAAPAYVYRRIQRLQDDAEISQSGKM